MNIQKLNLTHFRNFESASFSFDPETVHVLYGRNAQGKTNLLESIYYLSHLRSFRTKKLPSLVKHGQNDFRIECELETRERTEELAAAFSANKKHLFRYGNPVSSYSSFVGILNAVLFCPDDLNLFSLSPAVRRQFMDMELVKLSKSYTSTLSHFQKLLKERNLVLKERVPDRTLAFTYSDLMAKDQAVLIKQRAEFLRRLELEANCLLPFFSKKEEEVLKIRYVTCTNPEGDIEQDLKSQYEDDWKQDSFRHYTRTGAHKDDIEFYLNDVLLTQTASQGQKRTVLLCLKLALTKLIRETRGEYPILLLDDVFSELDVPRRIQLIRQIPEGMQVFITTTELIPPEWFDRPARFYTVDHGVMKEGIFDV